jgi:hypothetical protein
MRKLSADPFLKSEYRIVSQISLVERTDLGARGFAQLLIESLGRIFSRSANREIERPDVSIAHWEIGAVNCSFGELSHREGSYLILLSETPGRQIAHLHIGQMGRRISRAKG